MKTYCPVSVHMQIFILLSDQWSITCDVLMVIAYCFIFTVRSIVKNSFFFTGALSNTFQEHGTVEPRYNEVLGTMKITLLYQVSHYIRVEKQRNIKHWDQ